MNVVKFPNEGATESEIDKLHSEAFRDLESGICNCATMAKIAAQMVTNMTIAEGANSELVFAVAHVSEMLSALKASYYAAWHSEKQRDAAADD
jgi:hypothetical protein